MKNGLRRVVTVLTTMLMLLTMFSTAFATEVVESEALDVQAWEGNAISPEMQTLKDETLVGDPHRSNEPPDFYVAPDGSDSNDGKTPATAFKTLEKAKQAVRDLPKNAGDIVVEIADGFYSVDSTIEFTAEDSGSENCTIYYQAAEGAKPVFSGGEMLDKGVWTEATELTQTGGLTAYKTTLKRDEKLRAIYVNGERANMTLSEPIYRGTDARNHTEIGTPTVSFDSTDNPWAWQNGNDIRAAIVFGPDVGLTVDTKNPQNIEAVAEASARWARPFICFESIEPAPSGAPENMQDGGVMLRFQMPYGAISQSLSNGTEYNPRNTQQIRNAFEFLNKRGDFYFDQAEDTLYYIPLEGEDINTADVVIPKIETIIDIRGTPVGDRLAPDPDSDNGRVKNITFSGLTFAHTDYKLYKLTGTYTPSDGTGPVTTNSEGFASVQGCIVNEVYFPSSLNWHETFYRGYDIPPAAVRINAARNIRVLDGEVILTGFNGIHLENDVKDCEVTGNLIRDTLSSAIVVGHPQHIYENDQAVLHESDDNYAGVPIRSFAGVDKEKFTAGTEAVPQDIYITNNFIYRSCYGFPGANAFTSFYTTNMQVLHNFVYDTTYGAMSIGWGWCEYDGYGHTSHGTNKTGGPYSGTHEDSVARSTEITTTSRNNKVSYNRIEEICTVVNDSGAIYSLGRQGDPGNLPDGGTWDTISNLTNTITTDKTSNWHPDNWTNYTEMNYNFLNPNPTDRPTSWNNWTNGFHPDEGSAFIKMIGNVVQAKLSHSPGSSRIIEFNNWKRKSDMIFIDGYVDGSNYQNGAPRVTFEAFCDVNRIWPQEGHDIVLNSGPLNEYIGMVPESVIADTELELASNVRVMGGTILNRRGLLSAEDTVWIAPEGTTEFVEGNNMTKAAGNAKTIQVPDNAGEYKLYIDYADATKDTAVSKYTIYVDTAPSILNVEEGVKYDVSKVKPLVLELHDDGYNFELNGERVTTGHSIDVDGSWEIAVKDKSTDDQLLLVSFSTEVSEANKLLPDNLSVAPGGEVRFAYDLNDPTKEIWIKSSSAGWYEEGPDQTKTTGDKISMSAPENNGQYVLEVVVDGIPQSTSHASITVRDMDPVDIPRDGLDLWLKADEGVETDSNGNVTAWTNMGSIPATLVPANVTSSGGDNLGTPNGNPTLKNDVYDYVDFDAMSRPLKVKDFKDYNGKTEMTIIALAYPTNEGNNSSDQNGVVYFGLNEDNSGWDRNDDWSGINLGLSTNRVNIRFGNAVWWDGGGQSIEATVSGLCNVRAQLNGSNRDVYVNGDRIGGATNATALKGNRPDLSVGYTMSSKTPYRFLGRVAQILIYDRVLTSAELDKIEAYFDEYKAGGGGIANPIETEVDKTLLTALIDICRSLDSSSYPTDSWNAFEAVLSAAEDARDNNEIEQQDADAAFYELRDAFTELERSVVPGGSVLEELILSIDKDTVYRTETAQLAITGILDNGEEMDFEQEDAIVEYFSSNPSIASVDAFGLVTANKVGSAQITAMVTIDDVIYQSNSVTVEVEEKFMEEVEGIEISHTPYIVEVGEEAEVSITAKEVADLAGMDIRFSYDEELLELKEVIFNNEFGYSEYEDDNGMVKLIAVITGQDTGLAGDIELAKIVFKAKDRDALAFVRVIEGSQLSNSDAALYTVVEDLEAPIAIANSDITGGGTAINDLVLVAKAFDPTGELGLYDISLDMNKDGVIDIIDVAYVAARVLNR